MAIIPCQEILRALLTKDRASDTQTARIPAHNMKHPIGITSNPKSLHETPHEGSPWVGRRIVLDQQARWPLASTTKQLETAPLGGVAEVEQSTFTFTFFKKCTLGSKS
eukprot:scaffold108108_cov16-Prasinocladus_malaysianus.AAC.1